MSKIGALYANGSRDIFSYAGKDECGWDDGELTITVTPAGLHFSVEEEQAVDSYNQTFNCTCLVPWDKVRELLAMVNAALEEPAP